VTGAKEIRYFFYFGENGAFGLLSPRNALKREIKQSENKTQNRFWLCLSTFWQTLFDTKLLQKVFVVFLPALAKNRLAT
jgi:hypothetical protein